MRAPFSRTLHELVREQAERQPQGLALLAGDLQLTYADLYQRVNRTAGAMRAIGVRRGDRVGLLLANQVEWIEACLGATSIGAAVVPFSTWSTRRELEFLLGDSGVLLLIARATFGDRDFVDDLQVLLSGAPTTVWLVGAPAGAPFSRYEDCVAAAQPVRDLPPGDAASAADDALVLYTSGSTSTPKAVPLRHHAVIENAFNIGERQGLRGDDRVLLSPPLFWAFGSANAMAATFTHGATLVLLEKFDAGQSLDAIERHRCTAIYTLPAMTSAMLSHPAYDKARLGSLRTGVTIGSREEFLAAVEGLSVAQLCNIYGSTETYGNCAVTWHHWPLERRAACQGPALPGQVLRFVDEDTGAPVRAGEIGLVEVSGYVTRGYSGASAAQNVHAFTHDGFYRTGDLGRLNEHGDFVFVGRSSDMIKKSGINISPSEVEEVLMRHPAVRQAAVVGAQDAERGEIVYAFVVPVSAGAVTMQALLAHCREQASRYKVPDRIELCEALPLTVTGKLQRQTLKQTATARISHD